MENQYNLQLASFIDGICNRIEEVPCCISERLDDMITDYLLSFRMMSSKVKTIDDMTKIEFNILYNEIRRTAEYLELRAPAYGLIIYPNELISNICLN